jgi:hypothetical protein
VNPYPFSGRKARLSCPRGSRVDVEKVTPCPNVKSLRFAYASTQNAKRLQDIRVVPCGGGGMQIGSVKVVRKTDGRLLFPCPGAPVIGLFATALEARSAATIYGAQIVADDIKNPET